MECSITSASVTLRIKWIVLLCCYLKSSILPFGTKLGRSILPFATNLRPSILPFETFCLSTTLTYVHHIHYESVVYILHHRFAPVPVIWHPFGVLMCVVFIHPLLITGLHLCLYYVAPSGLN